MDRPGLPSAIDCRRSVVQTALRDFVHRLRWPAEREHLRHGRSDRKHHSHGTFPYAGTTGTAGLQLPRGEGFGPSEIDVTAITSATNVAGYSVADFKSLSVGKAGVLFDGRYGTNSASGKPPQAGTPGVPDKLGLIKHFQFPDDNFPASLASLSAYGSPSDMWGRMTVGLDFRGQPYYYKPTRTGYANMWGGELLNAPYNLNLSRSW